MRLLPCEVASQTVRHVHNLSRLLKMQHPHIFLNSSQAESAFVSSQQVVISSCHPAPSFLPHHVGPYEPEPAVGRSTCSTSLLQHVSPNIGNPSFPPSLRGHVGPCELETTSVPNLGTMDAEMACFSPCLPAKRVKGPTLRSGCLGARLSKASGHNRPPKHITRYIRTAQNLIAKLV